MRYIQVDSTLDEAGKIGARIQKVLRMDFIIYSISLLIDLFISSYSIFNGVFVMFYVYYSSYPHSLYYYASVPQLYIVLLDIGAGLVLYWGAKHRDTNLIRIFVFLQLAIWLMKTITYIFAVYVSIQIASSLGDKRRGAVRVLEQFWPLAPLADLIAVLALLFLRIAEFINALEMRSLLMKNKDAMKVSVNASEDERSEVVIVSSEEVENIIDKK
eukprot:TRINITY_DN5334_c0_g1_i1.p1 TRINITY_DN5334_c0_g1~~TRINITY_DN5334_c0_g1_i1.p1  ORF type:complete len:215 (-),score=21.55 TRINITY_DN5334_c0_g1_i1:38-682(-)